MRARTFAVGPSTEHRGGMRTEQPDQLQSLTPLRGIAALWVVLYHYTAQYLPALHADRFTHLVDKGYLAVDLFFMLSGFVLTHVYWRVFTEPVRGSYGRFLLARIARLYPLHLFVLSLFLATALASRAVEYATTGTFESLSLEGARSLTALAANIFMLQGLKASELSWNYPAWSISVEFIAYLGFPLALPWIWRARRTVKVVLALMLVAALVWVAGLTDDDFDQWDGPLTLLRCVPEFLIGSLLYAAFAGRSWSSVFRRDAILFALVAALVLLLHRGTSDLLVILLFPPLILAAVANKGRAAALLNTAPLVWLGEVSYSLYLFHGLVQFVTTQLLDAAGHDSRDDLSTAASFGIMTVMLVASLLCARYAHHGVEKAGRRRLRLLFGAWQAARFAGR
jgi:peptidoglycan/LPS O-acetylase OafA/YrhL